MADDRCCIDGCGKPRYQRRKMCSTHVMRKHRYGDPLADHTRAGRRWTTSNGYSKQGVSHDHALGDGQSTAGVHRVVLYAAIGDGPHPCHWCAAELNWRKHMPREPWLGVLVVDHLDDDKQNNDPANLVPSCFSCNALRARWGDAAVMRRSCNSAKRDSE